MYEINHQDMKIQRGCISPHTLILETGDQVNAWDSFVPDHFGYEAERAADDLVSSPCTESNPIANHSPD